MSSDPMLMHWPSYERRLLVLPALVDMPNDKRRFVMSQVRDAYLRCAPTLEVIPDCPAVVHRYVLELTYRLLAEVAKREEILWNTRAAINHGLRNADTIMREANR
jgi:hypothetical protein